MTLPDFDATVERTWEPTAPLDELRERLRAVVTDGDNKCPTCGRGSRGVPQAEIARSLGMSRSHLSRFLLGGGLGYEHGLALHRWLDERSAA